MHPHDTTPQKTCTKCGETKPATTEYFSRDKGKRDGFKNSCKACRHAYNAANKARNAEYGRAYREANKERISERFRAWYAANEKHSRAWREVNKERIAEHGRTWYAANKESAIEYYRTWRKANKELAKVRARAWRAANRIAVNAIAQRRRARKRNAEGTHTAADIQAQYKAQKGKCYYCATKVGDTYHVDHVIPLSRGGSNWPENLVIACPDCNCSKQDKLPHEWIRGGRLL